MEECSLDLIFFIYTDSFLVGVGGGGGGGYFSNR